MSLLKKLVLLVACVGATNTTYAQISQEQINIANIDKYMHSDIHIQSVAIQTKFIDKYFNCQFYHVTTTKASGQSAHVSFYPDTVAILPNGNALSVSKPADSSRLIDLEKCIKPQATTTSFAQVKEIKEALTTLYPFMVGVNPGQQYFIEDHKLTLRTANNYENVNKFDIMLKDGQPKEIYLYYENK